MHGQGSPNSIECAGVTLERVSHWQLWLLVGMLTAATLFATERKTCALTPATQQSVPAIQASGNSTSEPTGLYILDPVTTEPESNTLEARVEPATSFANNEFNAESSQFPIQVTLRMTWGNGDSDQWKGSVSIVDRNGTIADLRNLSLANDSPGSMLINGTSIDVNQQSPVDFCGADFTLNARDDTQLLIDLQSVTSPERRFTRTVDAASLIDGNFTAPMDEQRNQFTIARAPGDELDVDLTVDSMVFNPSELMSIGVRPNLAGNSPRGAKCRFQIAPARRTGPAVWTNSYEVELDESGNGSRQRYEIPVPSNEGVYDLEIELLPDWYRNPTEGRRPIARRTIQFVVLEPETPSVGREKPWRMKKEIAPSQMVNPNGLGQLIGMPGRSLGSEPEPDAPARRELVTKNGREFVQLNPGGWQAIELGNLNPGTPHVIEIEYDAVSPTAFGLSVLQPDAAGQIPLIGCDSGVVVPDTLTPRQPGDEGIRFHRIVFWPSSRTPYLLVANRDDTHEARLGKIRIYNGPSRLKNDGNESPSPDSSVPLRRYMAFYEAPLFPENFDAREFKDPLIDQPLDDWVTFYEGADRLVQYLKANSYKGAFITVASEGSSIYPGTLLDASPKYDSGIFFSNGQDLFRKDVLELLMRMFDREGLTLVPTLAMSSPLPAVEARRKEGVNGFDPVDFRQNARTREQSTIPVYNPLDPAVQKAVTDVVAELTERYASHSSFDSVALICRGDTYTQLPGQQWGYDPFTVDRFSRAIGMDREPDLLVSDAAAWIEWRAQQMSTWYSEILGAVRSAKPDARLYLAPVDLYRGEEISSALSPRIHLSSDFENVMLRMGFESDLHSRHEGVVLLQPHRIAPNQPLASERVEIQIENSKQARKFFDAGNAHGNLFTHRMAWAHFAELQRQQPFATQQTALLRLQQLTPSDAYNRRRFVQSIHTSDANLLIDGGILLSSGQDSAVAGLVNIFNRLPAVTFENVAATGDQNGSPIAVRQVIADGHHYFYAVNCSPWPVIVEITLQQSDVQIESLSGSSPVLDSNSNALQIRLEPYGMFGGKALVDPENPGIALIQSYDFNYPDSAAQHLVDRLQGLRAKLVLASKSDPIDVLDNPDFELLDTPDLDGWQTGNQPASNVRLESVNGHSGEGSVRLSGNGNAVWIRSNELQVPSTGRLSISAWIKTDTPAQQPSLRISIEGRSLTSDYYRFGKIGAVEGDSGSRRVDENWQRFAVHFDDLPVEGLSRLRIGFDLMGQGDVLIDSVRVYDRWLDEDDAKAVTQLLASAGQLLSRGQSLDSCRRILDSYWPRFLDEHIQLTPEPAETSVAEPDPGNRDSQISSEQIANEQILNGQPDPGAIELQTINSDPAVPLEKVVPIDGVLIPDGTRGDAVPDRSSRRFDRLRNILPSGKRR